jgi:hypothetical protein
MLGAIFVGAGFVFGLQTEQSNAAPRAKKGSNLCMYKGANSAANTGNSRRVFFLFVQIGKSIRLVYLILAVLCQY